MPLYLADATALLGIQGCLEPDSADEVWAKLTKCVEEFAFGFPHLVVEDLKVRARGQQVISWAHGLGASLNQFRADVKYDRWVMANAVELGFDSGFESIDGSELSVVHVCRKARDCAARSVDFVIVTEDSTSGPMRPSLTEFCEHVDWPYCGIRTCMKDLGLTTFLAESEED